MILFMLALIACASPEQKRFCEENCALIGGEATNTNIHMDGFTCSCYFEDAQFEDPSRPSLTYPEVPE